jgi:transcriptional regulator with XRE-family HTH domain
MIAASRINQKILGALLIVWCITHIFTFMVTEKKFSEAESAVGSAVVADRPAVGSRIRQARQHRRMTLRQLSEMTGLSSSFLSQFENGLTQASIASLRSISAAIGIELSELFDATGIAGVRVLRELARPTLPYGNGAVKHLLTPRPLQNMEVFTVRLEAGGSTGDDQFVHGDSEELLMVMVGSIRLELLAEVFYLEQGDSIAFRSSVPHRVVDTSSKPDGSEILWVISPPGNS